MIRASTFNNNTFTQKELPIYGAGRVGIATTNHTAQITNEKYELTDHLGNVRGMVMRESTALSFTDYFPFGMAMPNKNSINNNYRYAYQGQERDPETGKEAFELRLWDARIGRWLTTDPKREFYSPYLGMGNNPISLIDPDGGFTYGPPGGSSPINGQTIVNGFHNLLGSINRTGRSAINTIQNKAIIIINTINNRDELMLARENFRKTSSIAGDAQVVAAGITASSFLTSSPITIPTMAELEVISQFSDASAFVISARLGDVRGILHDGSSLFLPGLIDNHLLKPLKNDLVDKFIGDEAVNSITHFLDKLFHRESVNTSKEIILLNKEDL